MAIILRTKLITHSGKKNHLNATNFCMFECLKVSIIGKKIGGGKIGE